MKTHKTLNLRKIIRPNAKFLKYSFFNKIILKFYKISIDKKFIL
jgi:hypothetical protein